jgi:sortase A
MKHARKLGRLLMVLGVVLLGFYVAAKIHEVVLSRAAMRQFEEMKQTAAKNVQPDAPRTVPSAAEPQLTASKPSLVLWSEQRIKHYESSLDQRLAPPLAILRIPRIHVEAPVLEGTDDLTLNRGVGRIEGTARVGESGNVGIAGHRDGFFRGLKDIKLGDKVDLERPTGSETYIVDQVQIVDPADVSVLRPASKPALTLVTCYPFYYIGSAPQRYIVHATLADSAAANSNAAQLGGLPLAK